MTNNNSIVINQKIGRVFFKNIDLTNKINIIFAPNGIGKTLLYNNISKKN